MSHPEQGRGFVAVVPPDDVLDAVDAAATAIEVPSTARRTTRPQWHLTLARLKAPFDLRPVVAALGSEPLGRAWAAEEVVLFQSKTGRGGAEYTPRARFPLG